MRRRSTRHRNYLSRNQLVEATQLPEGYEMRTTQQGQVYFYHIATGVSTWHDPRVPRDLSGINTNDLGPLPANWEMRFTGSGRVYYVDHNNRTTQFTDPRLSSSLVLQNIMKLAPFNLILKGELSLTESYLSRFLKHYFIKKKNQNNIISFYFLTLLGK